MPPIDRTTHPLTLALLLALAPAAAAQRPLESIALPTGAPGNMLGVVFDAARQRVVAHTGGQPVEWNGTVFEQRVDTRTAGFTWYLGLGATRLAFDAARNQTLAVDTYGDWLHDGKDWSGPFTGTRPSPRAEHSVTFDAARDRVVLFGGWTWTGTIGANDETWEWDGSSWVERFPAHRPPALHQHVMGYDAARQRVVLFGGRNGQFQDAYETWEWDGTDWTQAAPTRHPPNHVGGMAWDPNRGQLLLANGTGGLWAWDGADWTVLSNSYFPLTIAFDAVHGELIGIEGDPFVWDGRAVSRRPGGLRAAGDPYPEAIVTDWSHGGALSFGGGGWDQYGPLPGNDTWTWDGAHWAPHNPAVVPPARREFGLIDDTTRGRIVLFGGEVVGVTSNPVVFDDLWEWDGTTWAPGSNLGAPSARSRFAFTWDSVRGQAVLFGGTDHSWTQPVLDETWEWDGTRWTQRQPTRAPSPRTGARLAFDPVRGRSVLFGGTDSLGPTSATWEWDGTRWTEVLVTNPPPPSGGGHELFFDWRLGRVVLAHSGAAWSWDGANWVSIALAQPLPGHPIGFDPSRFGWITPAHLIGDVRRAAVTDLGIGCPTSTGIPVLAATAPVLGNSAFRLEVLQAPHHTTAVLLFGLGHASSAIAGCTIEPARPWFLLSPLAVGAHGAGWTDLPLPFAPSLSGLELHAQAVVFDRAVASGFGATPAQRITLGDG